MSGSNADSMGDTTRSARVLDYMTRDVVTVSPDDSVRDVSQQIAESDEHSGFPVTDGRRCEGFITARDLLLADDDDLIFKVMTDELLVAHPKMSLRDAARVILRSGIQKLPVVDDAGNLVGIISNTDYIRSEIERATPEKVGKLTRTLENIHEVSATEQRREVSLSALTPTQNRVYADELEGRSYELENRLAEPLVVIDNSAKQSRSSGQRGGETTSSETASPSPDSRENDGDLLLADGHHRVKAADGLGIKEMDAYVIALDEPVELGMARTAHQEGLESIADIEVVDYAQHPLVETVNRLHE
jgi:CBS domain-containing protein